MKDVKNLNRTKWECKYHVAWIPKYRKKALSVELRSYLGSTFRELAMQKECQVIKGHLLSDHIHMLVSIRPKYSVSQVAGYLKGKSAIQIARTCIGRKKNFIGQLFWDQGYFVTSIKK